MLRHLTRLILLLALTFFASGETRALPNLRTPQNAFAGQKLASGIFSETIAILHHLSASQAAQSQREKTSHGYDFASGSSQAAESAESAARMAGCFVEGTLIITSSGKQEIQSITIGDKVLSHDIRSETWLESEVTQIFVHNYKGDIVTIGTGSELIEATGNHPFWVINGVNLANRPDVNDIPKEEQIIGKNGRWVEARDLQAGDMLSSYNGNTLRVSTLKTAQKETLVYNIEVENTHTYAVSEQGILVHNKAAAYRTPQTLQTGGHTLKANTLKKLGLSKQEGKRAIEALKKDIGVRNDFHYKVLDTGDIQHSQTEEVIGNLYDYVP